MKTPVKINDFKTRYEPGTSRPWSGNVTDDWCRATLLCRMHPQFPVFFSIPLHYLSSIPTFCFNLPNYSARSWLTGVLNSFRFVTGMFSLKYIPGRTESKNNYTITKHILKHSSFFHKDLPFYNTTLKRPNTIFDKQRIPSKINFS
jgi:hypothetical protein